MNLWAVFPLICGYERVGRDQVRLYVTGPKPAASFTRRQGIRTSLFRLYAGRDSEVVLAWLARNRAWQCLRVPPLFTLERGVRAVFAASEWSVGSASALARLARTRVIESEVHRRRLQREVRLLIESVIENPVREGELAELQVIEDVVNVGPVGVDFADTAAGVDRPLGSAGRVSGPGTESQ